MSAVLREGRGNLITVSELPSDADVVAELRALNNERGTEKPTLWQLVVEEDDDPIWGNGPAVWLDAGMAGPVGALRWVDRGGAFIPAEGQLLLRGTPKWLPYCDWSGEACQVHIAMRVPIERVFAAVAEVVASGRRPRSEAWATVDEDRHPLVGPRN